MNEQELQNQIVSLVKTAMSNGPQAQEALQYIDQVMQAAQNGDQQAIQLAQMIQAVMQQMGVPSRKHGAKLEYIKMLRGQCPEGTEMKYYKVGGRICKKCMAKQKMQEGGAVSEDPIEAFKCGKKVKKAGDGDKFPTDKPTATNKVALNLRNEQGKRYQKWFPNEAKRDSFFVHNFQDETGEVYERGTMKNGKWHPDYKRVYTDNGNMPKKKAPVKK